MGKKNIRSRKYISRNQGKTINQGKITNNRKLANASKIINQKKKLACMEEQDKFGKKVTSMILFQSSM